MDYDRLQAFLEDEDVPAEIRTLVKSRLDPDPPWEPESDAPEEA